MTLRTFLKEIHLVGSLLCGANELPRPAQRAYLHPRMLSSQCWLTWLSKLLKNNLRSLSVSSPGLVWHCHALLNCRCLSSRRRLHFSHGSREPRTCCCLHNQSCCRVCEACRDPRLPVAVYLLDVSRDIVNLKIIFASENGAPMLVTLNA